MQDNIENRELPAEVSKTLSEGKKIEAIKLLREAWDIDLKDAKDIIEKNIDSDTLLKEKFRQESNSGCLALFVVILIIAIAGYFLITK